MRFSNWEYCFLGVLMATIGCTRTVDTSGLVPPYKVSVYQNAKYSPERVAAADSDDGQKIRRWLTEHQSGWSLSFTSYAPFRLIRGRDFELNCLRYLYVLNYRQSAQDRSWTQVALPIRDCGDVPDVFDEAK